MTRLASPVKLIAGILYRDDGPLERVLNSLEGIFSGIDYRGKSIPFEGTDYYDEEMGRGLQRIMVSFWKLVDPSFLAEAKCLSRDVEMELAVEGKRRVNIDVGYLDLHKMVLASFKGRGNKIYLGRGVWADMTLFFHKKKIEVLPWSFPDFKAGLYDHDLLSMREVYRKQLRSMR